MMTNFLVIAVLLMQTVLAGPVINDSGKRFVDHLFAANKLGINDIPSKSIFLEETCHSNVAMNGTVDQKLKFFCQVVVKSDHCKNVPRDDLKDCNKAPENSLQQGVDFIKGCATGIFNSAKDLLSFLWEAGKFIWDNISDMNKASQTVDKASQFANSIKLYIYTEYDKAYETSATPKGLNAANKVAEKMMSYLVSSLTNMVKDSYYEFGCLNNAAKSERVCKVIGDFIIPPAALFAFLKRGAIAANTFPGIGRALSKMAAIPRLAPYMARLGRAGRTLNKSLSLTEKEAIIAAHLVGAGEIGANGALAQVGNYTQAQLRKKAQLLKDAGFSREEVRKLMEQGIVGLGPDELRAFARADVPPPRSVPATPRVEGAGGLLVRGQIPPDPFVSYVHPSGARLAGKVDSLNPVTGDVTVRLIDGSTDVIRREQLATVRNSTTSRDAFKALEPRINPSLQISQHPDPNYESVRQAFRQGKVPIDPYISYETPSGARLGAKIEGVDPLSGEVLVKFQDGSTHIISGEVLGTIRRSETAKTAFTQATSKIILEPHPERNYQVIRDSLNRNEIPNDPYISFESVNGIRIPGKIESINRSTGEVGLILEDGSRISLKGQTLESMRQSSAAREAMYVPPQNSMPSRVSPTPVPEVHPAIVKYNLDPKFPVTVRGVDYKVSDFFTDGDGRVFVIAEINVNGKISKSVFYRSNSSASFRNLPARNVGLQLPGYDKGLGEEFLAAPAELQAFLAGKLSAAPSITSMASLDPKELKGIIPVNTNMDEYLAYAKNPGSLMNQMSKPTEILASADNNLYSSAGHRYPEPQNIKIADPLNRPNYSTPAQTYKLKTEVYGEVDAFVYPSTNGQLEYTLLKDSSGRVWFSDIGSATSPINSHGVRSQAITGEGLLTPRWEYGQQIPNGFQGARNPVKSSYSDAWKYIKEMPEIKRWYSEQGLPIPE